jgi:hypothetical protein
MLGVYIRNVGFLMDGELCDEVVGDEESLVEKEELESKTKTKILGSKT